MAAIFLVFKLNMQIFVLLLWALGANSTPTRYSLKTQFNDSAIIVDADKSLPSNAATLPYYQPVQNQPSYRILDSKAINVGNLTATNVVVPNTAAIFTQEEFPRDLLEIAQHKLGLKTLDEVPSITELAELLGTNNAAETISYIRQLTSTDQGIALMRAYIESSDYTDSASGKENQIPTSTTTPKTTAAPTQNQTQPGFLDRMTAYFSIYNIQPQHKQVIGHQFKNVAASAPQIKPNTFKNMRPLHVRNPLPYHYPIPLRPLGVNRTALRKSYGRPVMMAPVPKMPPHLNTSKALSPAYIQQLARIANVSPNKLASFLQQKPKLVELAAKIVRFPSAQERNPLADSQLLAAVQKVMEQDEDLKKLLAANTLM